MSFCWVTSLHSVQSFTSILKVSFCYLFTDDCELWHLSGHVSFTVEFLGRFHLCQVKFSLNAIFLVLFPFIGWVLRLLTWECIFTAQWPVVCWFVCRDVQTLSWASCGVDVCRFEAWMLWESLLQEEFIWLQLICLCIRLAPLPRRTPLAD